MKGKFILTSAIALAALSANAQSNDYKTRIGHGQDSIDVIAAIQEYNDYYKAKDYASAYEPWKVVLTKAPTARVDTYKKGQVLLENLIVSATDAAKKKQYYDDLMNLYDTRLKNMDVLNSFSGAKDQSSKGGILCRKAYDSYFQMDGNAYNPEFTSMENAYKMFKEGINDTGNDTEGFVLYGFMRISDARFEGNKDNSEIRQDFINDYLQVTDICDRLLQQANEYPTSVQVDENGDSTIVLDPKAQKIIDAYQPTSDLADQLFVSSGAADCDALDKIYRPQVEANKSNETYLASVIKTLRSFDCSKSDLYEKASEYAYQLHPTAESAMGKASKALKAGNTNEAIKYLNESLSLESNPTKKAKLTQSIAVLLYQRGNYSQAMTWINKLPNNGSLQLLKASIVARSGSRKSIEATAPFCLAIDICNHAKAVDPSCAGRANKQIANYSANLYPKSEAFMAGIKAGTRVSTAYGSTTLRFR